MIQIKKSNNQRMTTNSKGASIILQHFFHNNLPKMHGMTKMQEYMRLFGSGINFCGGPGESEHKQLNKIPGQQLQHRVSEFAQQTALQYYNMLVSGYAVQDCLIESNHYKQSGEPETNLDVTQQKGDISIEMSGKYDFRLTRVLIEIMEAESKVNVNWSYNDKILKGSCHKYNLNKDLVKVLHRRLHLSIGTKVTGFTKATITLTSGEHTTFYAHHRFQGHKWYDWALVHSQEIYNRGDHIEDHYPSRILGFISIEGKCEAVIQCSNKPLLWTTVDRFFLFS
jgi:hypothetical protein